MEEVIQWHFAVSAAAIGFIHLTFFYLVSILLMTFANYGSFQKFSPNVHHDMNMLQYCTTETYMCDIIGRI